MNQGTDRPDTRLGLLYEMSRQFCSLVDIDELVPFVIERTKVLLNAESSALLLLDDDRRNLHFCHIADVAPEVGKRFSEISFPADRGIAGWIIQHGIAQLVKDVASDPRWYPNVDSHSGMTTHSLLCAPLRTRQGIIGVIELRNKVGSEFTAADLEFLDTLSASIAIALDNAHLYAQVKTSQQKLEVQVAVLRRDLAGRERHRELIGTTPAMDSVFRLIESAAASRITVLLEGETGTGKEPVARAIHRASNRADQPFVAVNCAALPETLLESQLFGHRRGSFTGAARDQIGFFEAADGGTIFLDEIGEMPSTMQARLLRVLQEGEVVPIGDTSPRRVDVRVISATNRTLAEEIEQGRFRRDLYYRLATFPITLPPLRDRRGDIPLLADHFLHLAAEREHKSVPGFAPGALDALVRLPWRGNVRELRSAIERAVALVRAGELIGPQHLPSPPADSAEYAEAEWSAVDGGASEDPATAPPPGEQDLASFRTARAAFEAEYIREALRRANGNVTQAARLLGLSRAFVHEKIKEYGVK